MLRALRASALFYTISGTSKEKMGRQHLFFQQLWLFEAREIFTVLLIVTVFLATSTKCLLLRYFGRYFNHQSVLEIAVQNPVAWK